MVNIFKIKINKIKQKIIFLENSIRFPISVFKRNEEKEYANEEIPFYGEDIFVQKGAKKFSFEDFKKEAKKSELVGPLIVNFWGHYICLVIDMKNKKNYFFDSLGGEYENNFLLEKISEIF